MNFLLPALLPGLALAVTPVAIYLILRRRKTQVPWGAGYLLRLTLTSRRKSSIWKQIVLLAVRTLILVLAGLLITQPFRGNPAPAFRAPALPDNPVHRVLLLDDSASMAVVSAGESRLDRLKAAVRPLLETLRYGDRASVFFITTAPGGKAPVSFEGPVAPEAIAGLLAGFEMRESPVALDAPLVAALAALGKTPVSAGEIYLLSDFPRDLPLDAEQLESVRRTATDASARVTLVNLAGNDEKATRSVVIHALDFGADTAFVGLPMRIYADAVCMSDQPLATTFVLSINGHEISRTSIELQPNERRRVPLPLTFDAPGPAVVRVVVDAGRPESGGVRDLALTVRDKLHIQIFGDDPRENDTDQLGDAEFLTRALAAAKSEFVTVEKHPANEVMLPIPDEVDVAVIAGPRFPRPAMAQSLAALAKRGGGVVLAVTADMEWDTASEDLAPILPAIYERPAYDASDPESFATIRPEPEPGASSLFEEFASSSAAGGLSDNNPLTRTLGDGGADLAQARIYNYIRITSLRPTRGVEKASVVFKLSDDQPLIVHRRLGRGHVYLLATTLGVNWNSLAVRQAYIPLFLRLSLAAAAGREPPRDFLPGTPVAFPWEAGRAAELRSADGTAAPVDVVSSGDRTFAMFDAPLRRGLYELSGGENPLWISVRGQTPEADARTLDVLQKNLIESSLGTPLHADYRSAVASLGSSDAARRVWPWLLAGVLALYLFECWFVRLL